MDEHSCSREMSAFLDVLAFSSEFFQLSTKKSTCVVSDGELDIHDFIKEHLPVTVV